MTNRQKTYTPEQYLTDLKAATQKALDAGIGLETVAKATMSFAHAVWDECFDQEDQLLAAIKAKHPTWADVGKELADAGFKN